MTKGDQPMSNLTAKIEKITPAQAKEYLNQNINNRKLRKTVVARYVKDMVNGDWQPGTSTIVFNGDGTLIDGQHRLAAVAESGVTIEMIVTRNAPSAAREAIDTGLKRSLKDLLDREGETGTVALASAIRKDWRWANGLIFNTKAGYTTASNAALLRHLDHNPGLRVAVPLAWRFQSELGVPASVGGPFLHRIRMIDAAEATVFTDEVTMGENIAKGQASFATRSWLKNQRYRGRVEGGKPSTDIILAYLIKGWNAWVRGEEVLNLTFKRGTSLREPFPHLVSTADGNPVVPLIDESEWKTLREAAVEMDKAG